MAWILLSILCIALTTTSAYTSKYPSNSSPFQQYESQYYGAQYRRLDDRIADYQARSRHIHSNDQRQHADPGKLYQGRTAERSIPGYSKQRDQDVSVAPKLEESRHRNENSSYKILNSSTKTYPSVTNRRGVEQDNAIVFPGPTSVSRKLFNPQLTDDCGELGICENSPDYPHEYVEALLANLTDASVRFNIDKDTVEIAQRGAHDQPNNNPSIELCTPDVRIIYPDKAKTKFGEVVYIINRKENKLQGFQATQCRSPGKPCQDIVSFPSNYVSMCEQKKMDRNMWALDEQGVMKLTVIPMPSCCTCVLQAV